LICYSMFVYFTVYFFIFKQRTAYEICLGIPAESLFRSFSKLFLMLPLLVWLTPDLRIKKSLLKCNWTIRKRLPRCKMRLKKRLRSEERRVGKEKICRGRGYRSKKKRRY